MVKSLKTNLKVFLVYFVGSSEDTEKNKETVHSLFRYPEILVKHVGCFVALPPSAYL